MARKTQARHGKVALLKTDAEFLAKQQARLAEFEPGSVEEQTWARYVAACRDEAEANARVDALYQKLKDLPSVPDKYRAEWEKLLKDASSQAKRAFSSLIGHDAMMRNTFNVAEKEVRQIVLDALTSNAEAWPAEEDAIPMHRQHLFGRLADEIIEELKTSQTKVREEEQQVPMCADCTAELAA